MAVLDLGLVIGPQGPQGATGPEGPQGVQGPTGASGVTYTPAVSESGVISWTNDGGKTNPQSVDLVEAVLARVTDANNIEY